jgi:hypothetical protein
MYLINAAISAASGDQNLEGQADAFLPPMV